MTELTLPGCRTTPLGGYLTALGLLRAVTRLLDGEAAGCWERQRFVLGSRYGTLDELVDELLARFEPEAIVSPWNAGSGFAGNGKNVTAERALQAVRQSEDHRLARLKEAVHTGDRVVALGRERGWGGKGDDLWDKTRKRDVLGLCRNEFPDHALPWLDAAVALGQDDDPAYSRLLGTGGNFGRQDLSATYLARVQSALTDHRTRGWLHSLLSGVESMPYLRDAVGQFDPGRAGGIQSSPWEKVDDKGFVNPWAFLLTVEGALLFATAVVRRHGTEYARVALPFQVRSSAVGYPTQAPGENVLGELWAPEWSAPAQLDEVTHLLAEGRAEWNKRPAGSGLDFARAVSTLGVDRGIDAFERHLFVDRHGQNPLAIPAGRIKVCRRRGVQVLAKLDAWLNWLRRADLPSQVETGLRAVEQALFNHARSGAPDLLVAVISAVGRCHEAVARSAAARGLVRPLLMSDP
ncbi:MAG: type I-U CRISPR-associated protein Csx17, partial [Pseudonocardiaceae bacterium]